MLPIVTFLALLALVGFLGYLLGIIGFFRAGAALKEARALRCLLIEEIGRRSVEQAIPSAGSPAPDVGADPTAGTGAVPAGPDGLRAEPSRTGEGAAPPPTPTRPIAPTSSRPGDFEGLVTMRWAVWLGAVALLLAGVFLIRYAADQGLLGPATRCGAAVALGAALLFAASWLQRRDVAPLPGPFAVDQVPPALAAGGIAVLFGAAYGAGPFYGLLSPLIAYAAMVAVSVLGLFASLRFGPLTAAVGILGAFVTPALVSTSSTSLVGLFAYLACASAAAQAAVRRTAWTWLGWAVTIAGAAWVLVAAGLPQDSGIWAAAAFVPVSALLGLELPAAAMDSGVGRKLAWGQFATIALAGLALEGGAPAYASRAALFALTPLAIWKAVGEPRLDRLPWLAAGVGLAALWLWAGFGAAPFLDPWSALSGMSVADGAGILLAASFAFAAAQAAAGLAREVRAPNPVHWAALVAAVPVLTLAVDYARIGRFEADSRWSLVSLLLAALLAAAAARAMDRGVSDRAGAHAAGTVAALALALAATLRQQWLGTALSLLLPGLAWVEARTRLTALRSVSLVVAATVAALISGWLLHDVALGRPSAAGDPISAYAVPAAMFALAALIFRRRGDDRLVAMLEAAAAATAALFIVVEVRLRFGDGTFDAGLSFDEAATLMLTAAAQAIAYDRAARRSRRATAGVARLVLGGAAFLLAAGLLVANPMLTDAKVGTWSLLFAYLVPALAAGWIGWSHRGKVRLCLCGYAVLAGFAWTTLQVRLAFHPGAMGASGRTQAELWAWSIVWLAYGLLLMILGLRLETRLLRLAALALVTLVCLKVFLVDMGELTGLLRVASFLGLGLVLIGLGALHRRFVLASRSPDASV